jgi:hypothetical protein
LNIQPAEFRKLARAILIDSNDATSIDVRISHIPIRQQTSLEDFMRISNLFLYLLFRLQKSWEVSNMAAPTNHMERKRHINNTVYRRTSRDTTT